MKNILKMKPEDEAKKKSFMNMVIAHSKGIPAPGKYSKQEVWAKGMDNYNSKGILRSKKVTIFSQLSMESKGRPGPATYKVEKSKDSFYRILGTYTS
jgi:hypothetical protein